MKPEGYIPPSLHTLSNHKLTCAPTESYWTPGNNGESLEAQPIRKARSRYVQYKFGALNDHQRPLAIYPNLNKCKCNVLLAWECGEKIYDPLSVLKADAPVTLAPYDGWKRHKNLAKSNTHNVSRLAPPKGEMKSSFSWTSLFKSPKSFTLCFGEPTLGKLNQVKFCVAPDQAFYGTLHLQISIKESSSASPSTFIFVTHLFILELHYLCQVFPLKHTDFPTVTLA